MSSGNVPRRLRVFVVWVFVAGLILGWIGFFFAPPDNKGGEQGASGTVQRIFDAAHSTLQLVVLNVEADKSEGLLRGIARVILPAAASIAILLFLVEQGRTWLVLGWLRARKLVQPRPETVAVIGCGRSGLALARYYRACGLRVVGLEKDPAGSAARRFRDDDFVLVGFDLMGEDALDDIPWWTVSRVVISTGDDLADMELARELLSRHILPPRQWITVSVDSAAPQRAAEFDPVLRRYTSHVTFLDLRVHSARLLFRRHAPHVLQPDRYRIDRPNPCHVVLSMQGTDLDAYVYQAIRALVYCPRCPLRVTVLTERAAEVKQRLVATYPVLDPARRGDDPPADVFGAMAPLAHVDVMESSPHQINVVALLERHRVQAVDVIYVKGRSDAETVVLLAEAVKAAAALPAPRPAVVAGFHERPAGDRAIVDRGADSAWTATGLRIEACWLDAWLADDAASQKGSIGSAARSPEQFNDADAMWYLANYSPDVDEEDAAARQRLWDESTEVARWFNRLPADHADIKLALLPEVKDDAALAAVIDQHLQALAELEHRRYVCERLLDGWIKQPDGTPEAAARNTLFHLNPTLRAFSLLTEEQKAKDLAFSKSATADMLKRRRGQQGGDARL